MMDEIFENIGSAQLSQKLPFFELNRVSDLQGGVQYEFSERGALWGKLEFSLNDMPSLDQPKQMGLYFRSDKNIEAGMAVEFEQAHYLLMSPVMHHRSRAISFAQLKKLER